MPFELLPTLHKKPVRTTRRLPLHPKDAQYRALHLLQDGRLSASQRSILHVLATAGALTTHQLQRLIPTSQRSLRRYYHDYLIDHRAAPLTLKPFALTSVFQELRLYSLGSVGRAWLTWQGMRYAAYEGYAMGQLTHDVLCNEVVISLIETLGRQDAPPAWYGKLEAQLWTTDGKEQTCALEPDALLVGKRRQAWAIEFHNENHRNRAAEKIERYEAMARRDLWRTTWPLDSFPTVLVVSHKKAVMDGYSDALAEQQRRGIACTYLGKPLQQILEGKQLNTWVDLLSGRPVTL